MMTVVTHVILREGDEPAWDDAMQARLEAARGRPGWVAAQLLIPLDSPNRRTIAGTWETRADWEAWHTDPAFAETRERLEGLQTESAETTWFEVLVDVRRG
jgi:heme-degrading monooxygenase HmoA